MSYGGVEVKVQLSKRSQDLINECSDACHPYLPEFLTNESSVELAFLIAMLNQELVLPSIRLKKSKRKIEFLLASLRAELLRDLLKSMQNGTVDNNKEEENASTYNKIKLVLIAISGTVLAACEGFDSITTIMGILSVPSWTILLAGLAFALLAVVVFYGFDLVQVSKNLSVKLRDTPKLLDVYLSQVNEIKLIRRKINTYILTELTSDELGQIHQTILMLQKRFSILAASGTQFEQALNSNKMKVAKLIFSGAAGLLFFGGGFFAGQSVAIFILGFFLASVTSAFWPVVLFSFVVGVSSFGLYWYVERVGLTKLISGWFGLDEDKIELLCDQSKITKEVEKLDNLKDKVMSAAKYTRTSSNVESVDESASVVDPIKHPDESDPTPGKPVRKQTSSVSFGFFPKFSASQDFPSVTLNRSEGAPLNP